MCLRRWGPKKNEAGFHMAADAVAVVAPVLGSAAIAAAAEALAGSLVVGSTRLAVVGSTVDLAGVGSECLPPAVIAGVAPAVGLEKRLGAASGANLQEFVTVGVFLVVIVAVATRAGAFFEAHPGGEAVDASLQVIAGVVGGEVRDAIAGVTGGDPLVVIVDVILGAMVG